CFDETSWRGKGPGAVASHAIALGKPVHVFAGRIGAGFSIRGLSAHEISPRELPLMEALRETRPNLSRAIRRAFHAG
ncbi:MAG TPA: glycerate kinase, partial [Opitutus sp.]|nr:glycerate kinase [Opitutus sp.]